MTTINGAPAAPRCRTRDGAPTPAAARPAAANDRTSIADHCGCGAATIQSMLICLPDGFPAQALTRYHLDRHVGVPATLHARLWARPHLWPWQRRQLITPGAGRPMCCAGGPVRMLDLAGMRHAAGVGAGIRHQRWQHVVRGTRPAHPWPAFQARHLAGPAQYPRTQAETDFWSQPRVNAMRLHNLVSHPSAGLPLQDLEAFQAGPIAYQHFSAARAVCGDALLTPGGYQLAPASDALAHRVTYLDEASRYLDGIDATQRLITVAL